MNGIFRQWCYLLVILFSFNGQVLADSTLASDSAAGDVVTAEQVASQQSANQAHNTPQAELVDTDKQLPAEPTEPTTQVGKHVSSGIDLISMLTSLAVVIVVIIISALLLKRFKFHQPMQGNLKVITSLSLGPKERLMIIQVAEQQFVIGVTPSSVNLISTLDKPLIDKPLTDKSLTDKPLPPVSSSTEDEHSAASPVLAAFINKHLLSKNR